MYEEKAKRKLEINWKSLLIKLAILLIVVFIILWIISLFKKDDNESNFGKNLGLMRDAAEEYFTGSKLPSDIDDSASITLKEMYNKKLLIEFRDEEGNSCDVNKSYAKITKTSAELYRLEVKLVCNNESDTIVNTLNYKVDDEQQENVEEEIKEEVTTNNNTNTQGGNTTNSGSTGNKKPTAPSPSKPEANTPSEDKPVAVVPNDKEDNSENNNNNISYACGYGKNENDAKYPLAYAVSGDCAVSYTEITGNHANAATIVGNREYQKLIKEVYELENKTGKDLEVANPDYELVKNIDGNGYVGYQIAFSVKEKNAYSKKTVYAYYLDLSGNRIAFIDNLSSLYN